MNQLDFPILSLMLAIPLHHHGVTSARAQWRRISVRARQPGGEGLEQLQGDAVEIVSARRGRRLQDHERIEGEALGHGRVVARGSGGVVRRWWLPHGRGQTLLTLER